MRTFSSYFAVLLALALYGLPWTNAGTVCNAEIDCGTAVSARGLAASTTSWFSKRLTNAERLAKRLPLIPPVLRRHNGPDDPQPSPTPKTTYHGVLQVINPGGVILGYVATDPNYWTPLLTPDISGAQQIEFQLPTGATSGTRLGFNQLNRPTPLLGLVQGRDSTSSDIGSGNFNYLYFNGVFAPGTPAGSTPQDVPSELSTATGVHKTAETSVWSVNLITGAVTVQWINVDSSTPPTAIFIQSNHLYAGGDSGAFHSRFPAPVIDVTLKFIPTL